jgi:hypothetical protein
MSASVRFNVNTEQARQAGREAAEQGLGVAMEHLLGESRKLVPHEEGTLERTGTAVVEGLSGAVYFDTPYAARQHEELTWRHDPGRQAKYLEKPAAAEADTMLALVAARIRRALR